MTDAAIFRDLARRAREATGSDDALDGAVADALGLVSEELVEWALNRPYDVPWTDRASFLAFEAEPYSLSLDAVIRDVVPAGCQTWLIQRGQEGALASLGDAWGCLMAQCHAATPALALLAASLEARAVLAEAAL